MHPILLHLGSFRLPTYGVLVASGLLVALGVTVKLGKREGLDAGRLLDFSTWLIVVGIVGAKVLMVLTDWRSYWDRPSEIFTWRMVQAAGVFYGGFIAAFLFAIWYIRVYRLPAGKVFDIYAPAVALAQSIGRLGCFGAGCDYGKAASGWLAVTFTNPLSHDLSGVPLGVPIYPTQLLESAATLAIFGILLARFRRKKFDGEIFMLYVGLYAVARFFLEFLRGDEDRGFVFNHLLSTSQFVAILAGGAALAAALYWHARPQGLGSTVAAPAAVRPGKGRMSS